VLALGITACEEKTTSEEVSVAASLAGNAVKGAAQDAGKAVNDAAKAPGKAVEEAPNK
jgi:hypothetical protein